MRGEHKIVVTSVGRLLSGREAERGFWDALHVQNYMSVVQVKIHQAEHLRFVLLNVCKLFLNKSYVVYVKKKKAKENKNISMQANKQKTLGTFVVNRITLKKC